MILIATVAMLIVAVALGLWTFLRSSRRRKTGTAPPIRLILPMTSGVKILPGTSAKITAQPQDDFRIDGLFIEDAADWVVSDLLVDGQSQFVQVGDVPGSMFSGQAQGCGMRLAVAPAGSNVSVVVTYVGFRDSREFRCLALGTLPGDGPTPETSRLILPLSSGVGVLPNKSAQITAKPDRHFRPERLVIHNGQDWTVNEVKVGNRSQLLQSGDVPGSAFDASVTCALRMESVSPKTDLVLVVTYVGENPDGAPLWASMIGEAAPKKRPADTGAGSKPPCVGLIELDQTDEHVASRAVRLVSAA